MIIAHDKRTDKKQKFNLILLLFVTSSLGIGISLEVNLFRSRTHPFFPVYCVQGLRVLIVDGDPTYLRILEKMLRNCRYEVTKCSRGEVALKLLEDNRDGFDIVMSDLQMSDMDGFKFLEQVGLEMELSVIMISAHDSKDVVTKGVAHGACDYLIKPVRMEPLKNIWQHVIRGHASIVEDGERQQRAGVWSVELHQQFVATVNQIGIMKAVPKRILDVMNVPGLLREAIAHHLQKYRLYFTRLSKLEAPSRPITFI